jgi:hypothetical protein
VSDKNSFEFRYPFVQQSNCTRGLPCPPRRHRVLHLEGLRIAAVHIVVICPPLFFFLIIIGMWGRRTFGGDTWLLRSRSSFVARFAAASFIRVVGMLFLVFV